MHDAWMPHRWCFNGDPWLTLFYVTGHLGQAFGYALLSWLIFMAGRRSSLALPWRYKAFGWASIAYLMACGASHVATVVTLWTPAYIAEVAVLNLGVLTAVYAGVLLSKLVPRVAQSSLNVYLGLLAAELRLAESPTAKEVGPE